MSTHTYPSGLPRTASTRLWNAADDPSCTYDWANLTGDYADVSDFARMCRSCHRRYDNARVVTADA